jgi:hypothetical protein
MKTTSLKQENLALARELANQPHVKSPIGEYFTFSVANDGQSVRLHYRWEEVWRPEKLQAYHDRQKARDERIAEIQKQRPKDVPVDEPGPDAETVARNLAMRMDEDKRGDGIVRDAVIGRGERF